MNTTVHHGANKNLRILPVRDGSALFELSTLRDTLALLDALEDNPIDGVLELIPAARTILISFDPLIISLQSLITVVSSYTGSSKELTSNHVVDIPVYYDGEDLPDVADLLGCSIAEIIERHTNQDYIVAFTGFAPGFAYLAEGNKSLYVPRRKSPRTNVPAGSVAIAGEFSGVYPKASPGGWQLLGRTPLAMFDINRSPAALLQPGFRVRFRDLAKSKAINIPLPDVKPNDSTLQASLPFPRMEIVSAGLPALFQDNGRIGKASLGVSEAGAADQASLKLANRLVGNPTNTATIELSPAGFSFKMAGEAVIALTGAPLKISILNTQGTKCIAPFAAPFALNDGDLVSLSTPTHGMRTYLAIRGGYDVEPVLESVSYDTLAQIGSQPLVAGNIIGVKADTLLQPVGLAVENLDILPQAGDVVDIDVAMGPRTDWFTQEAVISFLQQEWLVTPKSSRVGIRLEGEALERKITDELPSEATLHGAIQVPASGQPVLFLADHPLTGGYPVIANVAEHHLDLIGQVPVGARIRFKPISPFEAINITADEQL